jgi:hypothetical protein
LNVCWAVQVLVEERATLPPHPLPVQVPVMVTFMKVALEAVTVEADMPDAEIVERESVPCPFVLVIVAPLGIVKRVGVI